MRSIPARLTFAAIVLVSISACRNSSPSHEGGPTGASPAASSASAATAAPIAYVPGAYPAPRWPSYFKAPKSVDDLMPAARALVRNTSGFLGVGMGVLKAGESVLMVPNANSDPQVIQAITKALEERKVKVHTRYTFELLGKTREQTIRERTELRRGRKINEAGLYQASQWITGQFPDPSEPKKWLKQRRPDVYAELFPGESPDAPPPATPPPSERGGRGGGEGGEGGGMPMTGPQEMSQVGAAIQAYITQHPEIRGVFWGTGGGTGLRRAMYPMQEKFLGTMVIDNIWSLQSQMTTYPGDVWQLAEEQMLEPLIHVDRVEITDPEGTNLWADISEEMAGRWAAGAYQRGHLYMFPNQATGRFGYGFIDYPAFQQKWLPREPITRANGVIAGTQGHGGFYPRWEVNFKDGFIADVKGGGAEGAALKEFLNYPGINDRVYPYHTKPGFWYLYEIAIGTHPKAFRAPQPLLDDGNTVAERARSGVIHWGLGIRLWHDPTAPTESKVWADFTKKYNVPFDHGWHTHTYFTTYKVRLRGANKWVNLLDKGHMTPLDNPEVRALASRYGDPDYLLTEDWIPEVPGINVPGDYLKDYASHPGDYALKLIDNATKGTYQHYFPLVPQTVGAAAKRGGN